MSTENQEVTVEPAAEEKTETKEVKGTKRAAEVSIFPPNTTRHHRNRPLSHKSFGGPQE